MIVLESGNELRVVTQPDHARVGAEMLSLWRAGGLPEHPRRAELLYAVREHDNGWRETDAAPHVDPSSGRPYSFLDLPDRHRIELWDRGSLRYLTERPYAALLITEHGRRLHLDRPRAEPWVLFLEGLDQRLDELSEATGIGPEELADDYPWLALADDLSLRACGALGDEFETAGFRVHRHGAELTIDPFPLAGSTTFSIPCRHIPKRRYASATDLAVELASAGWSRFDVRLLPPA